MPVAKSKTRTSSTRTRTTRRTDTVSAAAEKAASKPKAQPVESAPEEGKSSFIFFNCDDCKSQGSMNIFYNHEVYADTKKSRKLLLNKIKTEVEEKRVHVDEANWSAIENLVVEGNPEEAGQYLGNGSIFRIDSF